jgi:hypothetical protein
MPAGDDDPPRSERVDGARKVLRGGVRALLREHPRLGDIHEDERRKAALEAIFTTEWPDDGAAASGYTDWILEARQEAGDDTRAVDEVAKDLVEFLTEDERYERMNDLRGGIYSDHFGQEGLSFTQVNNEMANGLVNVFGAYVEEFGLNNSEDHARRVTAA